MVKIKSLIGMTLLCIGLLSACNKMDNNCNISFIGESVLVNQTLAVSEKTSSANFIIFFVYSGEVPKINLIGVDGDIIEGTICKNETIIEEFAENYEYEGYKVGCEYIQLDFTNINVDETMKINKLTFDVDGKKIEVNLKNEVVYSFVNSDEINSGELQIRQVVNGATGFPIICQNVYNTSCEMEIIEYTLGDSINFTEAEIFINEESQGGLESLPVKVKSDSILAFESEGELNLKENTNVNVYTNVQVSYKVTNDSDVVKKNIMPIAIVDFDSKDDVDKIVRQYLNNK